MMKLAALACVLLIGSMARAESPGQPVRRVAPGRETFPVVQLPADAAELKVRKEEGEAVRKRGPSVLEQIEARAKAGKDWRELAKQHLFRTDDADRLLLEIRLKPDHGRVTSASLARELGLEVHGQNVPSLFNAWVPAGALERLRAVPEVATVQRVREARTPPAPARKPQQKPAAPQRSPRGCPHCASCAAPAR